MFLMLLFLSATSFATDDTLQIKKIGEYKAKITFDPDSAYGQITIQKGKKTVYQQGDIGHHFFFGLEFDKADRLSGKNITGNNIPNLVVTRWTGGASCCHILSIFELGKTFRKIIEIDAFTTQYDLINLDKDKNLEIEIMDGAIRGVFACTAGSPNGRVVLKFKENKYIVASELMRKPKPSKEQIGKMKKEIAKSFEHRNGPDLPYVFLESMLNLSYSGNLAIALQIAEEVWPLKKEEFQKFKADFLTLLDESSFWKEFSLSLSK